MNSDSDSDSDSDNERDRVAWLERSVLPSHSMPYTYHPLGGTLEWLHGDNLEDYRKRGGHPIYGEHDILYQFNSFGYRCSEFDAAAAIRIVAVGCSYVFGIGLAQRDLFHERFAARLRQELSRSVVLWNLSMPGGSNDYISRVLHLAVPRLKPHMVLVNFTHSPRREYISVDNEYVNYHPGFKPNNRVTKEICRHLDALSSPYDDRLNFFKNYKAVEVILRDLFWLYSTVAEGQISAHMDLRRQAGVLQWSDRARDGRHPGPESHRILAEQYWTKFVELGGRTLFGEPAGPLCEASGGGAH